VLARCGAGSRPAAYLADAELMIRAHLLPSQLRDVSFIRPSPVAVAMGEPVISMGLLIIFGVEIH
jgi:hypothetical protein